jgi:hypothetical protein
MNEDSAITKAKKLWNEHRHKEAVVLLINRINELNNLLTSKPQVKLAHKAAVAISIVVIFGFGVIVGVALPDQTDQDGTTLVESTTPFNNDETSPPLLSESPADGVDVLVAIEQAVEGYIGPDQINFVTVEENTVFFSCHLGKPWEYGTGLMELDAEWGIRNATCALKEAGFVSQTYEFVVEMDIVVDNFGNTQTVNLVEATLLPPTIFRLNCSNPYDIEIAAVADEYHVYDGPIRPE